MTIDSIHPFQFMLKCEMNALEHNGKGFLAMNVTLIIFMVLVIWGIISLEHKLKKKLNNDERIIARLDILINDLKASRQENR